MAEQLFSGESIKIARKYTAIKIARRHTAADPALLVDWVLFGLEVRLSTSASVTDKFHVLGMGLLAGWCLGWIAVLMHFGLQPSLFIGGLCFVLVFCIMAESSYERRRTKGKMLLQYIPILCGMHECEVTSTVRGWPENDPQRATATRILSDYI